VVVFHQRVAGVEIYGRAAFSSVLEIVLQTIFYENLIFFYVFKLF